MLSTNVPHVRRGTLPRARDYNRLVDVTSAVAHTSYGSGNIVVNSAGVSFLDNEPHYIYVEITGNDGGDPLRKYSWKEVQPLYEGSFIDLEGGLTDAEYTYPAYEFTGSLVVPTGYHCVAWQAYGEDSWYFYFATPTASGGTFVDPVTFQNTVTIQNTSSSLIVNSTSTTVSSATTTFNGTTVSFGSSTSTTFNGSTTFSSTSSTSFAGLFVFAPYAPTAISATQNNWAVGQNTPKAFVTTTGGSQSITGIAAGTSGQLLFVVNTGSEPLVFTHQDSGSTAANRVIVPWATDCVLGPNDFVLLEYDGTAQRWRVESQRNPAFEIHRVSAPDVLEEDQDDYSVGLGDLVLLSGDGAHTLTGFPGGLPGRELTLLNAGNNSLILAHNNVGSAGVNRIYVPHEMDYELSPGETVRLHYEDSAGFWYLEDSAKCWFSGPSAGPFLGKQLHFVAGDGVDITVTSPGSDVINVEIDAGGGGAPGSSALEWVKVTVTHDQLQTAALTNDIVVYELPARGTVHHAIMKHSAQFAGGSISTYFLTLGITIAPEGYTSSLAAHDVPSGTGFVQYSPLNAGAVAPTISMTVTTNIRLFAVAEDDNLDQSTAGSVDIFLLVSTAPSLTP